MDFKASNRNLFNTIAVLVYIVSIIFALSLFAHRSNTAAKEKKALISENIDLKNQLDSITATLKVKTEALAGLETERIAVMAEMEKFRKQSEECAARNTEEIDLLKKENKTLRGEMSMSKKLSVIQAMKAAISGESNDSIRRILEDAMQKIEAVRAGRSVILEPIVVTEGSSDQGASSTGAFGKVLSIDTRSNLIAIDLGRANNARAGQRCSIIKDGEEIGSGEIIRTRYSISAVFVDDIKNRYNIRDIRVGDRVSIQE